MQQATIKRAALVPAGVFPSHSPHIFVHLPVSRQKRPAPKYVPTMLLLKYPRAWIVWLPLCCISLASAMSANEIAGYFRRTLSSASSVYLTSDPAAANATTRRWDLWSAPTYIVAVKPATRTDVQQVVSLYIDFALPCRKRS